MTNLPARVTDSPEPVAENPEHDTEIIYCEPEWENEQSGVKEVQNRLITNLHRFIPNGLIIREVDPQCFQERSTFFRQLNSLYFKPLVKVLSKSLNDDSDQNSGNLTFEQLQSLIEWKIFSINDFITQHEDKFQHSLGLDLLNQLKTAIALGFWYTPEGVWEIRETFRSILNLPSNKAMKEMR